ncbi:hypothetical protein CDAR_211791 [Caerostris darwini]|uniref:Uncharacterized protein n=1 Tax=Caerostris darwini TaxID=1538125 RepID=A0AAV4PFP8_9ARAC|nr:hypothetical protein CDAR_211791 [Caerostris darwini]
MPIATGSVVTVAPRVGDLCLLLVSVRTKDAFISLGCYVPEICAEGPICEKEVYRVMKNLDSHGRCVSFVFLYSQSEMDQNWNLKTYQKI